MSIRPTKRSFTAWLLAALLLWVGAVAVAHELDHVLENHQEPCALHHYAGHHGGLPTANAHPPAPPIEALLDLPSSLQFFSESRPAPYAVRAPPSV
jgi:hypothetical protein